MNKSASLSVVIPCYNAERYLASTVDSVLLQNGPDLEVVIVDDGSRDGSADLIRQRYGSVSNVRLLQQANQGVAAARNHGVREARGEWIAFVDADDIWLPGKLRAQMDLLSMEPEARMAYTAWQVWSSAAPLPTPDFLAELQAQADDTERWSGATGWIYPQLLLECAVWTSTVLAHRSVFDEVGLFDTTLPIGEDWDLWLRASRVTPIVRVPRPPGTLPHAPQQYHQGTAGDQLQGRRDLTRAGAMGLRVARRHGRAQDRSGSWTGPQLERFRWREPGGRRPGPGSLRRNDGTVHRSS
jgi:GT2 family glycosyltransferase